MQRFFLAVALLALSPFSATAVAALGGAARAEVAPAVNLAQLLAAQGEWERAEELLQRALEVDGDDVWALYDLAVVTQHRGALTPAADLYARAERLLPQQPAAQAALLGARIANNLGVICVRQARWEAAAVAFARARALMPSDPDGWFNAGLLAQRRGDPLTALQQFAQVLRLQPGHVEARRQSAEIYLQQGALAEATADLNELP